jgi:hypothetical protein
MTALAIKKAPLFQMKGQGLIFNVDLKLRQYLMPALQQYL